MKSRNKVITCINPVNIRSSSLVFGSVSSGIEPVRQNFYIRKRTIDEKIREEER